MNENPGRPFGRSAIRGGALIVTTLLMLATLLLVTVQSRASSHREAPLISKDPFADNTDTYVWVPAGQTKNVALAASWIPFEGPEGGPNYYEWDDRVLYDIYVDNDGDAKADVTYTLSSRTVITNPDTFLYNTGPMTSLNDRDWNRKQYISVTETWAAGAQPPNTDRINRLVVNRLTAPVNIGSKSTPRYGDLSNSARFLYTSPNGDKVRVFAGQTDDPFWVDLQVFDLLTLRGQQPPIGYSSGNNEPVDSLSGFNVHSLIIELPIERLTDGDPVLGVWAGSRRATMNVMSADAVAPADAAAEDAASKYVQVSRLGMPLVNEVVLPMSLKDTFNSISPDVDLTVYGALQESVEDPEVGNLLCALYGVPLPGDKNDDCKTEYKAGTPRTGRGDIFDIFLTGMVLADEFTIQTKGGPVTLPKGFNVNRPENVVPAEMIRINTAISGDLCAPEPSRLGVLGGDACGYPNGRRPMDDTVDISLLAVAGAAYPVLDGRDKSFSFNPALINVLDDGLDHNDRAFRNSFPYFPLAQSGQSHRHENPGDQAMGAAPLVGATTGEGGGSTGLRAGLPSGAPDANGPLNAILMSALLAVLAAMMIKTVQVRRATA